MPSLPSRRYVLSACVLAAAAFPCGALAQNGAATAGGPTGAESTSPAIDAKAPQTVSNGVVSMSVRPHVVLGKRMLFRGVSPRSEAGRTVAVERWVKDAWQPAATGTVKADGTWLARWKTSTIGRFRVRATVVRADTTASTAAVSPELGVVVYRPSESTWYGPGFYGRRTACGVKLTKKLVGVAHKTLPCGTQVAVMYKGKALTVPVVDRGPFRAGTDWDLTYAAARAIGFEYTDTIGAVRLRDVPPVALDASKR